MAGSTSIVGARSPASFSSESSQSMPVAQVPVGNLIGSSRPSGAPSHAAPENTSSAAANLPVITNGPAQLPVQPGQEGVATATRNMGIDATNGNFWNRHSALRKLVVGSAVAASLVGLLALRVALTPLTIAARTCVNVFGLVSPQRLAAFSLKHLHNNKAAQLLLCKDYLNKIQEYAEDPGFGRLVYGARLAFDAAMVALIVTSLGSAAVVPAPAMDWVALGFAGVFAGTGWTMLGGGVQLLTDQLNQFSDVGQRTAAKTTAFLTDTEERKIIQRRPEFA